MGVCLNKEEGWETVDGKTIKKANRSSCSLDINSFEPEYLEQKYYECTDRWLPTIV